MVVVAQVGQFKGQTHFALLKHLRFISRWSSFLGKRVPGQRMFFLQRKNGGPFLLSRNIAKILCKCYEHDQLISDFLWFQASFYFFWFLEQVQVIFL